MPIIFHAEDITLPNFNKSKIKNWITNVIECEKKTLGDLNYIFTSNEYLAKVNKEYLNHDYYTDIITFDYCVQNMIIGDIFISTEMVKDNSKEYAVSFENELFRVIVHGVLHLSGYNDSSEEEKAEMRNKEDHYLNLINDN